MEAVSLMLIIGDRCTILCKASFTRTIYINITVFMILLMDTMGVLPNLPIKVSVTIDTMLKLDTCGDGDVRCKETLKMK